MNVKKSLVVAGAVATVGMAGLTGLGVASAAANTSSSDDPMSGIIDKIAAKFNLNKQEVRAVFEEERVTHEAEHEQRMEDRLSQAVTDGKITEEQKKKIIAKWEEIHSTMKSQAESLKDMTHEERRTVKEQRADELKTWAEENDIPEEYMFFGRGKHMAGPHAHPNQ